MISNIDTDKKYVYVLLSRTSTAPSKLIRAYTREQFAHTSIATDINLYGLYSFARKKIHTPLNCGFIHEDINKGIFGRDKDTICRVYAIPVTDEEYKKVSDELNIFIKNKEKYKYNYRGIVGVMFNKPVTREYKYFCSEFVSSILLKAGIEKFDKNPSLASPSDFKEALHEYMIYEGLLTKYRDYVKTHF